MGEPTAQQHSLGWETVDLKRKRLLCMWRVEGRRAVARCGHRSLTSARRCNGNLARNWRADGQYADEVAYGQWLLRVEGASLRLWVRHIDESDEPPVTIETVPVVHEKGRRGHVKEDSTP